MRKKLIVHEDLQINNPCMFFKPKTVTNLDVMKLLVEHQVFDFSTVNYDGDTILHFCVQIRKGVKACEFLLQNMDIMDINRKNKSKQRAFDVALAKGDFKMVQMMLKYPEKVLVSRRALLRAAEKGFERIVKALLEKLDVLDIDINQSNKRGRTALHIATLNGHNKVIKLLLKHPRIKPNRRDRIGSRGGGIYKVDIQEGAIRKDSNLNADVVRSLTIGEYLFIKNCIKDSQTGTIWGEVPEGWVQMQTSKPSYCVTPATDCPFRDLINVGDPAIAYARDAYLFGHGMKDAFSVDAARTLKVFLKHSRIIPDLELNPYMLSEIRKIQYDKMMKMFHKVGYYYHSDIIPELQIRGLSDPKDEAYQEFRLEVDQFLDWPGGKEVLECIFSFIQIAPPTYKTIDIANHQDWDWGADFSHEKKIDEWRMTVIQKGKQLDSKDVKIGWRICKINDLDVVQEMPML